MKRFPWITAAVAAGCALAAPAAATAAVTELGATSSPLIAPTCPKNVAPANCTIILTEMTAVETVRDGLAYPTTVRKAGQIVAFTLGLSNLSSNRNTAKSDIHYLDTTYGGTTRAAITVLKASGSSKLRRWKVVAESPMFHVQPYLGEVVQIPLTTNLPVTPGEVVALTTSTWVPVLSIDLSTSRFSYRQSRTTGCNSPPSSNQAQLKPGTTAQYTCNYPGTRVEYSATEITNPVAGNPIHAADKPAPDRLSARTAPFGRPARSGGVAIQRR